MRSRLTTPTIAFLAALGPLLYLVWHFAFVCDDAYIAFRYGRNLAAGLGISFNPGVSPPVEGYTQLGWVLWLALLDTLGADLTLLAPATTAVAAIGLLAYLVAFLHGRLGLALPACLAGALFLTTHPSVGVWSTGGLGTMVFTLALFGVYERLLGDPDHPRPLAAGVLALLALLLRADAPWWLAATLGLGLFLSRGKARAPLRRATLILGGVAAAGFLLLLAWRWSYHGDWLPQTARTKVGFSSLGLERGGRYLLSYWLSFPALPALLLLASLRGLQEKSPLLLCSAAMAAATFLYGVLVGGDFMCMGRLFLPALPHLAVLFALLVHRARTPGLESPRLPLAAGALAAAALLSSLLPAWNIHLTPASLRGALHFRWNSHRSASEFEQWQRMEERAAEWSLLGRALDLHTRPGESLVAGAIGAVGFHTRLFIHDRNGLVTRAVTEVEPLAGRRRSPGHDRTVEAEFFLDLDPTYLNATLLLGGPDRSVVPRSTPTSMVEEIPLDPGQGFPPGSSLLLWRPRP